MLQDGILHPRAIKTMQASSSIIPTKLIKGLLLTTLCSLFCEVGFTQQYDVPLDARHWAPHVEARSAEAVNATFESREGFPFGVANLPVGAIQTLQNFNFQNGTIEFDMKATGDGLPGVRFRLKGDRAEENSEELYLRPSDDCRASNDCVQYAPIINGFMLWNVFPQYQAKAPVFSGWNHFKLVVSGARMNLFVNDSAVPIVKVGKLESGSERGSIALVGPAMFANLTVTSGAVEKLPPWKAFDRSDADEHIVHHWYVGSPTPYHQGAEPSFSDAPAQQWQPLTSERFGFVNLNRLNHSVEGPSSLTWLRFKVRSDGRQTKTLSIGWMGQVWIFVNGAFVGTRSNFYYPSGKRQMPDGRYSLSNGQVQLKLQSGENIVTFAVNDTIRDSGTTLTRYGLGLGASFEDVKGLHY